jgi:hypothetical protein
MLTYRRGKHKKKGKDIGEPLKTKVLEVPLLLEKTARTRLFVLQGIGDPLPRKFAKAALTAQGVYLPALWA